MSEQSIASARASVMIYDDNTKKWIPSGSSSGLSKVHIYQHLVNNTFRVVGRKLQDHEVVINCSILKGLKYNQATQTFHQWRDNKQVYGLNFSSKEDADAFATAMLRAIEMLNNSGCRVPAAPAQQSAYPGYQHLNGPCGDYEDLDLQQRTRTLPRDEYCTNDWRIMANPGTTNQSVSGPPTPATVVPLLGHHRTSSAPPAPAPPAPNQVPVAPPPPPAPPAPPAMPAAPAPINVGTHPTTAPPPPPPPPAPDDSLARADAWDAGGANPGSLATALACAKLRKTSRGSESENAYGTVRLGNSGERSQMGGMASMMDEMAKTLARRRAAAENQDGDGHTTPEGKKGWDKSNGSNGSKYGSSNGAESPKPGRRQRFGSVSGSDEFKVNGAIDSSDLERLKAELLAEMNNMKMELLQAIRSNRR